MKKEQGIFGPLEISAIVLFLAYTLVLILTFKYSLKNTLFAIATFALYTHIIFGAYYLTKKVKKTSIPIVLITIAIIAILLFMILNIENLTYWYLLLAFSFVLSIVYYFENKKLITQVYLYEYVNYKTYVETKGLLFTLFGLLLYLLLPSWGVVWGILTILTTISINYEILVSKRAYNLNYSNPSPIKKPFVSIVAISYNEEKYIGKLLDSIKDQTFKNFEVILVDDHSTDKTREIASKYKKTLPLRIVQKDKRGQSRSRNYGASLAKGNILLFLDSDVILPKNLLKEAVRELLENNISIATLDFKPITDSSFDKFSTRLYKLWLRATQFYDPHAMGACTLVRKETHNKIKYDETIVIAEDFEYSKRASRIGKFRFMNNPPVEISWRRYEKENRLILNLKYLYHELYRTYVGEIRKKITKYDFGDHK